MGASKDVAFGLSVCMYILGIVDVGMDTLVI